jgi:hypothetical protein
MCDAWKGDTAVGMPWMKLFTEELDRDCRVLSLQARGAWIWIFLDLRYHAGTRSLSLAEWARVIGASIDETAETVVELINQKICDSNYSRILPSVSVTFLKSQGDATLRLSCRRLVRESKVNALHNLRQQRYRERRHSDAPSDAAVTRIDKDIDKDKEKDTEERVCSSSGRRGEVSKISTDKTTHTHTPVMDFVLTDELQEWAEAAAPNLDAKIEAEKFRDYYARNGKSFADLSAAFRKWIRDAVDRQNQARAPTARWESIAQRNARVFQEVEAEDAAKAKQAEHGGRGS